ncbi:PepSY-associated TM helix domain-containing protein [Roseibium sediminicola]|uniref:PepSY domain-containing protein n=1 Tax=Roseibium sediminicola TaxID=2933272 RepID=A0ABT0H1M7_9HYPH|nr:PepSY domain-containing protein [Roseibium sp. CAU 1639]MCK7615588.1 PepSY domain-containing protein [Roseibium sp. CAU 1639]
MSSLNSGAGNASIPGRFYLAAWRWHFFAGLYVVPFLIMLAVTGLGMMYISVFDGRDGEYVSVTVTGDPVSLSDQATAALTPFGTEAKVVEWIGAKATDRATVFRVSEGDINHMVAVDPYQGTVIDSWNRRDGWYDLLNDIHGSLLIGTIGDRLIEIAAGLALVLIVTGLYLWWPRKRTDKSYAPDLKASGRELWKSLHKVVGAYVALALLVFLVSGLSWAGIWGEKIVQAWSTFPAEKWSDVPLSDETHAAMNHGAIKDVPWGLEQTKMPASGSGAGLEAIPAGMPVNLDTVAAFGRALGYESRFRISFPRGEKGVWTLNRDSMSNDSENPMIDRTVHLDRYTGRILADVGFADYSLPAKGMAVGIAFHEGDMGLWNIVLNTVFCLSVIFLCISGLVMWWARRPKGSALRVFAPKAPDDLPHWRGAMILMLALSLAFPLVGLTLLIALALDYLVVKRVPALRRAIG